MEHKIFETFEIYSKFTTNIKEKLKFKLKCILNTLITKV